MPESSSDPYATQIAQDQAQLRAATGLGHAEYIAALTLLVAEQARQAEFLLAEHHLPIPWPARKSHALSH
jgi:hypothetical protein